MALELRIGEIPAFHYLPYFYPLKEYYPQPEYRFVPGAPAELSALLRQGLLEIMPAPALEYALAPQDYLLLPGLGVGCRGPFGAALLFSDILLDDLDEGTVSLSPASVSAATVLRIVLTKYLQYTVEFQAGWGDADAFLLVGDAALRERNLSRYNYVYDIGELWRYYTHLPLVVSLWTLRREIGPNKSELVELLRRSLGYCLDFSEKDYSRLAGEVKGYEWLPQNQMVEVWSKIQYHLEPDHFEGLVRFYQDAEEIGVIEQAPTLEFFSESK